MALVPVGAPLGAAHAAMAIRRYLMRVGSAPPVRRR